MLTPAPVIPAEWTLNAACRDAEPDIFFPGTGGYGTRRRAVDTATEICAVCPVAHYCYAYAKANDEHHGIWGGHDFGNTLA